jgi:hypothetical protein
MAQGIGTRGGVTLFRYLSRLYDTISSRADIIVEYLVVPQPSQLIGRLKGRLRFADGSWLEFEEEVRPRGNRGVDKVHYSYHHQRADGKTMFRYDNAPHHRAVKTFPHHKHVGGKVASADAPDLHDVLREIDEYSQAKRAQR